MPEDSPRLRLLITQGRDHIQGSPEAVANLVEYGDYQCPYCGEAYPIVKKVQEKFASDLCYVFRNFPLTDAHPFAETSAEVAEAAGAQGKFWEMHDFIYEHQQNLSNPDFFVQYAGDKLNLDSNKMAEEISNHTYLPRIREDFSSGVRSGVNGTPTFFINGVRHNGDYSYETLVAAIENATKEGKSAERVKPRARKSRTTTKRKKSSRAVPAKKDRKTKAKAT